jgi:hypothetical protein
MEARIKNFLSIFLLFMFIHFSLSSPLDAEEKVEFYVNLGLSYYMTRLWKDSRKP